jgi:hypothetical protein
MVHKFASSGTFSRKGIFGPKARAGVLQSKQICFLLRLRLARASAKAELLLRRAARFAPSGVEQALLHSKSSDATLAVSPKPEVASLLLECSVKLGPYGA